MKSKKKTVSVHPSPVILEFDAKSLEDEAPGEVINKIEFPVVLVRCSNGNYPAADVPFIPPDQFLPMVYAMLVAYSHRVPFYSFDSLLAFLADHAKNHPLDFRFSVSDDESKQSQVR